jgi:hypothetical protein
MSFLSPNSSFETYRQNWESGRGLRLADQLCNVSHFLCRLRRQLRYGELSRAPLTLLRLQLFADTIECDWLARPPDAWDADLPGRVGMRHASLQTLRDAIDVRSVLFHSFPSMEAAYLRVFRQSRGRDREMIVTGYVQRNDNSSRWVHSLTMRARNLGFRFNLEGESLCELPEGEEPLTRFEFQLL